MTNSMARREEMKKVMEKYATGEAVCTVLKLNTISIGLQGISCSR